jgi:uncharacterized membrane protein (DUF485 family)
LVVSIVGVVVGLVLHAKNAAQATSCSTTFGVLHQQLSPTFRTTCTAAKSMTGISTGIMVACGVVAAITIVMAVVYTMQANQSNPAT